jgi:tetratricopeptide (TPR) repeat protein
MLHPHRVNAVAFSPDIESRSLLVACADGSSQLWDRATCKRLGPPAFQARPILAARFSPNGRYFLTATDQGIARVWPVPLPLTNDLESLTLGLQVRTGREMGPGQTVLSLSPAQWSDRRRLMAASEVRAESVYTGSVSETAFHEASARDAESRGASYAVRWHLDQLIAGLSADTVARSSGDAWLLLARQARGYANTGQLDRAAAEDRRAMLLATTDELVRWYKQTIMDRKEWSTARWYLDRALAAAPADGQLRADKSRLECQLGQIADSQSDLDLAFDGGIDSVVLFRLGDDFVRDDRFSAAAAAYSHAIERGLAPYFDWLKQAVVFLKAGDRRGYQRLCAAIVAGASEPPHPQVVNVAAWVCALAPEALPDYSSLIATLEQAAKQSPPPDRPDFLGTLGSLLYQSGRYREAVARIEEAIRSAGRPLRFEDLCFLAMAHHRLGDALRAREYFSRLKEARLDDSDRWHRLEQEFLQSEASALFEGSPAASRPKASGQ